MTDEVVCEREFNTVIDGEAVPILVRWVKPQPDQADWRCEYVITWPNGSVRRGYAMGVDSAQALILAFRSVSTDLELTPWPVRWFENADDLGLPTFNVSDHRIRVITARGEWPHEPEPASDR